MFLNYNAFAYPKWVDGKLVSITPLQPTDVDFYMTPTGELKVHMVFKNGYEVKNIIINVLKTLINCL